MFRTIFQKTAKRIVDNEETAAPQLSRRNMLVGLGAAGAVAVTAPTVLLQSQAEATARTARDLPTGNTDTGEALSGELESTQDGNDIIQAQWRGRRGRRRRGRDLARRCRRSRRFRRRNRRLCRRVLGWRGRPGTCIWFGGAEICF